MRLPVCQSDVREVTCYLDNRLRCVKNEKRQRRATLWRSTGFNSGTSAISTGFDICAVSPELMFVMFADDTGLFFPQGRKTAFLKR